MNDGLKAFLESLGGEKRIDFGLERFQAALRAIGNPEQSVKTLIIGGTNGKGTTVLFLSSALRQAGFSVLTYLSPHLQHPKERILHNLASIHESVLESLGLEYEECALRFRLTYFEFLTLLCFVAAKRNGVDFLVLEVGLGGRLDATNVTNPLASVITNISLDHEQYLGTTLESILDEKMAIVRPEGLLFTHVEEPALLRRIREKCEATDAVYYFAKEIKRSSIETSWLGQTVTLNGYPFELTNPSLGTLENAALAFHLLRIVFPKIPISTLQAAFRAVRTPGRLEVVSENPRVVLSGDHNLAGMQSLLVSLKRLPTGNIHTLCAFSPDKPYQAMFQSLRMISKTLWLTELSRYRDQMPAEYSKMGEFRADPYQAVASLISKAESVDTLLVTGSLYLVGELRKIWRTEVQFLA